MVDLFRTDERLVFGLAELDPYRPYRDEPICAPPEALPPFVPPPVKPRLFVYLGSEVPHLETIAQALVGMDIDIVAYLRGDVGPLPHFLKHRGHKVYDTPRPLDEVLPTVSHVMSQGGAFTCQAALMAGRPHLVVPLHNETELNLMQLGALGVAQRLEPSRNEKTIRAKVNDFLMETDLIAQARHWALTFAARQQKDGLGEATAAVTRAVARVQMRSSRLRAAAAAAHPSK
jgi:UDP:flavonoid glycosyltransferase YjiC (YdhE family)